MCMCVCFCKYSVSYGGDHHMCMCFCKDVCFVFRGECNNSMLNAPLSVLLLQHASIISGIAWNNSAFCFVANDTITTLARTRTHQSHATIR